MSRLDMPPPDPRATLHAGDPASLADVVAASAREPHADVVLQALHVSGGAAAIGVESPVPWCLKCNKPVTGFAQEIVAPVDAVRVRAICHGETFERTYTAANLREHGISRTFFGPIPGLVCAACDKPIEVGDVYAGRTGNATHRLCMSSERIDNLTALDFKVAGKTPREP